MIIVSQDKTEITNFNNINLLKATKEGRILSYDNAYDSKHDCSDVLGKYKTEERAKEVLQEILQIYRAGELSKIISGEELAEFFSYEMPEE